MAADGFSASINAFTSQNYGAKNYDRVKQGYKTGMLVVGLWGLLTTAILITPRFLFLQKAACIIQTA